MIMSLTGVSRNGFVKLSAFDARCQSALGRALVPPSIHYVTLGQRWHLSVPQFPHQENGDNNSTHPPKVVVKN